MYGTVSCHMVLSSATSCKIRPGNVTSMQHGRLQLENRCRIQEIILPANA